MSRKKSLGLTYVFAVIGGIFGLHHLYLGRTKHALLWLTTFGGFGIGICYEILFKLKQYVEETNNNNSNNLIIQQYKRKLYERKSPAFELKRFLGQYCIALFYGLVTYYAFPETWLKNRYISLLIGFSTSLSIALGIQLVGTIGPRKCSFIWPLLGALLGLPFLIGNLNTSPAFNIVALFSAWIFEWNVDWDPEYYSDKSPRRKHFVKRCLIYGCAIYQNLHVDIRGERVKVKDVLAEFFKSQEFIELYEQLKEIGRQLYIFYLQHGFKGIWTRIWEAFDSESDKQAFKTLELKEGASQKDIDIQCRTLSRKWHPDRYRDLIEKEKAEVIFMNIQQACNRLSDERKRRELLNSQKRENPQ